MEESNNKVVETLNTQKDNEVQEGKEEKKRRCSYFPSAYTILVILEFIFFILTYIIPKGKFNTIEYDKETGMFVLNIYNKTKTPTKDSISGTQETLTELGIKIPFESFKNGNIKKAISIPNTYTRLEDEENANFFDVFTFPIYGLIDSSGVAFAILMTGGCIRILVEMNALTAGIEALGRVTNGHEIILLILAFFLVSIGGTTFGMCEEIFSFYPVLMPIFLKSGLDGALAGASLYIASTIGTMFSTVNPFAVVIGSYSAGINFIDGIVLRVIGFIIGDAIVIIYFIIYQKRVRAHPEKSAVYDIKDELKDKFLKNEKKEEQYYSICLNEEDDDEPHEQINVKKPTEFTIKQKISLIVFALSFILLIIGVSALDWWFEQLCAIFFFCGIILIILLKKGENKSIELFMKGAGDFVGVVVIIGLARGINVTLEKGLISDTILYGLTKLVAGLPKVVFAIIMYFVFIILGLFFVSTSGLAMLSMPILAPLADEVNCSRATVVNAFMFGQNICDFFTPTGFVFIVLELVGMKYSHWMKFSWLLILIIFFYLIIMVIISAIVY